ncbi:MAG: replicative DNA helicase [Spartobacteria bacterium]|nr:replicative DNA helicase [Spartobacteria bacterium]
MSRPGASEIRRVPPYSEEAEKGVLGSILLDYGRVIDLCNEKPLTVESFYNSSHQLIYEAVLKMTRENRPIDLLTLGNTLKDADLLDQCGGRAYLEELVDSTPTDLHATYYIDIVHQKFLRRCIIDVAKDSIEECYTSDATSQEVLSNVEQNIFEISNKQRVGLVPWREMITNCMQGIDEMLQQQKNIVGISSGFRDIDRKLLGLKGGDMIVLAARPSMGKTSLALNIAERIATPWLTDDVGRPVAVFSLEMPYDQLVKRMLCSRARVPAGKIMGGSHLNKNLHHQLIGAADALSKAPFYLDDTAGLDVVELVSRARRMKQRYHIEIVVIDYLQLLKCDSKASQGRQLEVAAISGMIKAMAKNLNVPVLVLSQLSRASESRDRHQRPQLSDLRDSGSIEQDADVVLMLRRPSRIPGDERSDDQSLAILDIAKNRNGPTGELELNFLGECTRFDDRTQHGVDPGEMVDEDDEDGGFEL